MTCKLMTPLLRVRSGWDGQEAMRSRQIAERLGVEEAHMLEFQQFNAVWDKKMADYEKNAAELVVAMKASGKDEAGQGSSHPCLWFGLILP